MLTNDDVQPTSIFFAPASYVCDDETPNTKDSPEAWLNEKSDCGHVFLLHPYEEGGVPLGVTIGDRCTFTVNKVYPDITVKVAGADDFEVLSGHVPRDANQFYTDDWESAMDTLAEFIHHAFEEGEVEAGAEIEISVRHWGEEHFVLEPAGTFRRAGELPAGTVAGQGEVIVGAFELHYALACMKGVIERRNTIPILAHVLVQAVDGKLEITGTNLDQRMTWTIPAATPQKGGFRVTIPFRQVEQFAGQATGLLKLELTEGRTRITAGNCQVELHRLAIEDFPSGPRHTSVRKGTIYTSQFHERLKCVQYAISREETRYYLNGVCFHSEGEDGDLAMVATNGHQLAKETMLWTPGKGDPLKNRIVPRRTVAVIADCIGEATGTATLEFGEMSCRLAWGVGWADAVLVSKLIDGTYPPYERFIPSNFDKSCMISANALAEAVARAATINGDKMLVLSLEFNGGECLVETKSFDTDTFAESLQATFTGLAEGQTFKIGFNGGYVEHLAKIHQGHDLKFEFVDAASPARITAPARINSGTHILMPVRV